MYNVSSYSNTSLADCSVCWCICAAHSTEPHLPTTRSLPFLTLMRWWLLYRSPSAAPAASHGQVARTLGSPGSRASRLTSIPSRTRAATVAQTSRAFPSPLEEVHTHLPTCPLAAAGHRARPPIARTKQGLLAGLGAPVNISHPMP
jgi:hypothetical protein